MSEQREASKAPEDSGLLLIDEHIEESHDDEGRKVRHRGVYLLPNLFTTANLFAGFFAIINAVNGRFEVAAIAVFVAMLMDGFDGRVARMTNTQSAFGAEYDSLSDLVAFGLAPALLAYEWALRDLGNVGLGISFVFVACAALRLARFNTQIGKVDKRWFIGLASPAAAGVIAGAVWALHELGSAGGELSYGVIVPFGVLTAVVGLLMVSNVKYHSFKDLDLKGRVPFIVLLAIVLVIAVVSVDAARVLLLIFLVYAVSGPIQFALGRKSVAE